MVTEDEIRAVMRELGKRGGKAAAATRTPAERQEYARKGALARAAKLSPERRKEIARKARAATRKTKP